LKEGYQTIMTDIQTPAVLRKIMQRDLPVDVPVPRTNESYAPPAERDRLRQLESELARSSLDEIAYRISHLTYGELKEFSSGIEGDPDKLWNWSVERASK
jgi:hypothetical protein